MTGGLKVNSSDPIKLPEVTPRNYANENGYTSEEVVNISIAFNQRRFFVFFAFVILASNIATSSIAERCNMMPMVYFVFLQNVLIVPLAVCWCYARPLYGAYEDLVNNTLTSGGGQGFLYSYNFLDRCGIMPIILSGALSSLVASAVLGPRYGVFMPTNDQ